MTFKVDFSGICTHFLLPDAHRVVLVKWAVGTKVNDKLITKHVPLLKIRSDTAIVGADSVLTRLGETPDGKVAYLIHGAWFKARGADGGVPGQPVVPSLTALNPDKGLTEDPRVVTGSEAACHFDLRGGTVVKDTHTGAVVATVSGTENMVEIWSLDTEPKLLIGMLMVSEDATFWISNECSDDTCKPDDFLLSYLVCQPPLPTDLAIPASVLTTLTGLTVGCSNSQFP
jgi:hypothetical protein